MVQIYEDQPNFASRLATGGVNVAGEFGKAFLGEKLAQRQQQEMSRQVDRENEAIKEKYGIDLAGIKDPKTREMILAEKLKGQSKEGQNNEIKNTAQKAFNMAANLIKKGNLGIGSGVRSSVFGGETAEDYGQFQSAMGGLEAMLVDMVSRGTLSNARFKYITETLLPRPTDRDREKIGKMKALAELLDLDASALGIEKKQSFEQDPYQRISETKELTPDVMKKIFSLSKGDKEEAKRIAKKMGYKI